MRYTVSFFTREMEGKFSVDEHEIARFVSDLPIPVPNKGDDVCLESGYGVLTVEEVCYGYPKDYEDHYEFEVTVYVKEKK